MKLHIKLTGTFKRTPVNCNHKSEAVTLQQWMRSHFAVATQVRQRKPAHLRQRFGLNFLAESSIEGLLQQARQTKSDLVPPWLQPSETIAAKPVLYRYEFVSEEAQIQLQPDDPQLPIWETNHIAGSYQIVVEENTYPGLSSIWLDAIWLRVRQAWENYSSCDLIQMALASANNTELGFSLPDLPAVEISVDINQLTPEIREAIAYLRKEITESEISSAARELVQEYQQKFALPADYLQLPENIELKTPINPSHQFLIGKRISRKAIAELISQAEQFLFISSYIIEDRNITELICQKAASLPLGVWILTDLNHEVIDAIDTQVEDIPKAREAYQHTDAKKAQCLKLLLAAGARIRGGAFHLKTYISETAAYLGSCNLTGGSLDFNLESGLICCGTNIHQDLLQYFIRCWKHQTKYDILPLQSGFTQRTLNNLSSSNRFTSQTLLNPKQYREDLAWELSKGSEKVAIYSRNFSPDAEILSLLATRSTRIYADGFINNPNPRITTYLKSGVHAKVTLIGDRVAYVGGVNFIFSLTGFGLIDLMYKTCDRDEIIQIKQQLAVSAF